MIPGIEVNAELLSGSNALPKKFAERLGKIVNEFYKVDFIEKQSSYCRHRLE